MRPEVEKYFNSTKWEATGKLTSDEVITTIETKNTELIAGLAANPNLIAFFQKHLCLYEDAPIVQEVLASRSDACMCVADILVSSNDHDIQLALAENVYMSKSVLMTLANSTYADVKTAALNNPRYNE